MHNPEKSRVLCVVATGSYWALIVVACVLVVGGLTGLVATMAEGLRSASMQEVVAALKNVGVVVLFFAVIAGITWLGIAVFEWAKKYRRDC